MSLSLHDALGPESMSPQLPQEVSYWFPFYVWQLQVHFCNDVWDSILEVWYLIDFHNFWNYLILLYLSYSFKAEEAAEITLQLDNQQDIQVMTLNFSFFITNQWWLLSMIVSYSCRKCLFPHIYSVFFFSLVHPSFLWIVINWNGLLSFCFCVVVAYIKVE